jgi:tetratricopeptide (TPR) repeat protein
MLHSKDGKSIMGKDKRKQPKTETIRRKTGRSFDKKSLAISLIPCILIIITGFALYSHSFNFPLENLDEPVIITANLPFISNFSNVGAALMRDAFFSPHGKEFYRPFQNLSYMIDAQIGGPKPSGFRFMTIFLHCLTCCVLYFFLRSLKFDIFVSGFFALAYTAHPLFTHVALWIPSRGDILLALFGMLTFIFFLRYLQTQTRTYLILHVASFFCAVYSKETSVLFPVVFLAYFFIVPPKRKPSVLIAPLSADIAVILSYILLRFSVVKTAVGGQIFGLDPLFSNLASIPEFIAKYFLPINNLSPLATYTAETTFIGLALIGLIFLAIVWLKRRGLAIEQMLFFLLWFLVFLIPGMMYRHELSTKAYDYLEHRSYLPLIGIVVITSTLIAAIPWKRYLIAAGVLYFGWFAYSAYSRSFDYRDVIAFYDAVLKTDPMNSLSYNDRAIAKSRRGDLQGAMNDYSASIRTAPEYVKPINNRGNLYYKMNKFDSALLDYNEAIRRSPSFAEPYNGRGVIEYLQQRIPEAMADFNKAIALDNAYPDAYNSRASLHMALGEKDAAIADYEMAIRLKADYTAAIENLKSARQSETGPQKMATQGSSPPSASMADYNRAGIKKAQSGDLKGAFRDFSEVIRLNPNSGDGYANRGNVRQSLRDTAGAIADWTKAVALGSKVAKQMLERAKKR